MDNKNIIITGSMGFIGQELVKYINENYKNVHLFCYDRKEENERRREAKDIMYLMEFTHIDYVIHLAAQTSVFNHDLWQIKEDNIDTFMSVALACVRHKVKLIYASSSTANINNVASMYGMTKWFNEQFASVYCKNSVGLRFHNVYSDKPREGTLLWNLLNKKEVKLYNNGKNVRCYTWVEDVVKAICKACTDIEPGIYNVFNDEPITTNDFAMIISSFYNINYNLVQQKRKYDVDAQVVDRKIKKIEIPYHKVYEVMEIYQNREK